MATRLPTWQASFLVKWKPLLLVCLAFAALVTIYVGLRLLKPHQVDHKPLRILCFGDSLTEGATTTVDGRRKFHPYSLKLQQNFDNYVPMRQTRNIRLLTQVHNAGVSGELVQNSMEERLSKILKGAREKYDWVIILGGTNDIRRMQWVDHSDPDDPKMVFETLTKLHRACYEYGAHSVVVTIPARQCEVNPDCSEVKEARNKINDWLRRFVRALNDQVALVDLARKMELPQHRQYWSDEVHFTPTGYDKMADTIFEVLKQYV